MTRLSKTAVVASAALIATSHAFTLSSLHPTASSAAALSSSSSSGRRCVRSRAYSASQQPSMVASVPRTVVETGTEAASKQRLHVQVRACLVGVPVRPLRCFSVFCGRCGSVCSGLGITQVRRVKRGWSFRRTGTPNQLLYSYGRPQPYVLVGKHVSFSSCGKKKIFSRGYAQSAHVRTHVMRWKIPAFFRRPPRPLLLPIGSRKS